MTQTTSSKSGYSIAVTCPGCGADLALQQDFFVLACQHCASVLRLTLPERPVAYVVHGKQSQSDLRFSLDRFLKQQDRPLTGSTLQIKNLYYPYWKIDGLMLKVRNRIERREINVANDYYDDGEVVEEQKSETQITPTSTTVFAGEVIDGIPDSLGMRTEYIELQPFSEERKQAHFDCLRVQRSAQDALGLLNKRIQSAATIGLNSFGVNRSEVIEPKYSLVYFPFHLVETYDDTGYRRFVLDGLSGRVLDRQAITFAAEIADDSRDDNRDDSGVDIDPAGQIFGSLNVEFHRCTNCGEDLPQHQSQVYLCRNCETMVNLELPRVPLGPVEESSNATAGNLFPFWVFDVAEQERPLIQRLFGGIARTDTLVIPAFRSANFEAIFRLSRRMSAAVSRLETSEIHALTKDHPMVRLGVNHALAFARAIIYREQLRRNQKARYADTVFTPERGRLLFVAFQPQSYFYVDTALGAVTFEKRLVSAV